VITACTVNGIRIAYSDSGEGTPLLCLHGGMGVDRASLEVPGILRLAGDQIRLIIPDLRGHGQSGTSSITEYTHDTWVGDVRALVAHVGLSSVALLGHSYGGFLALEYARRWPETLTHLVLVATSAGPVRAQMPAANDDATLREQFRALWPHFFSQAEKHWDIFNAISFSAQPYNAAFGHELPKYDVRDVIRALDVPMLLIVGRDDAYLSHMEWLVANAKNARLRVLDGAGHFPFVEAEEEFATEVTSFLNAEARG